MKIKVDPGAAALLAELQGAGYPAYVVGGCVRDSLLGLPPHDWDLCTAARPEQVMALFGESQCIPTGLQHGTVTVKRAGKLYEITTFRTEGSYSDGRHPDVVAFVPEVREDLARRDFTINAMAYSPGQGLVDPFGGQEDLKRGLVRAVGEPVRRFEEDALRILRLYRFAARFGFGVDPATEAGARELAPHLDCVSAERIQEELNKLLAAPRPGAYLEPEVLAYVLPELPPPCLPRAREVMDALPAGEDWAAARWAALLLPLGQAGARRALKGLKCSNAMVDEVTTLVGECQKFLRIPSGGWDSAAAGNRAGNGMAPLVSEEGSSDTPDRCGLGLQARRLLGKYDLCTVQRLTALWTALAPEEKASFDALGAEAQALTAQNACCRVAQLAVNGRDLMGAGVAPGPGLRRTLEALLEQVITGRLPNEKEALLAFARQAPVS